MKKIVYVAVIEPEETEGESVILGVRNSQWGAQVLVERHAGAKLEWFEERRSRQTGARIICGRWQPSGRSGPPAWARVEAHEMPT